MKRFITLVLFLAINFQTHAQSPRMTVRQADGSEKTLAIAEADISVRILGDVAETVIALNFRNEGDRAVEGEFALTLPAGATVSGYALEVNGAMRAAVSVEKERARTAYETVKRRLIDPGIVEREAGNIYRTKVYPVPAKGTKRLRISYTETLNGAAPVYSLPLDFPDPVDSFTMKLEGENLDITETAGADFTEAESGGFKAEMKSFKPTGTLHIGIANLPDDLMAIDGGPDPAFMLSTLPPDLAPRDRPAPKSVDLIWDASGSGLGKDHTAELALLDAWFKKLGGVNVKLFTLRNTMEQVGGFEVRDGKWADLRKYLEEIDYDGATDFSQIQIPAGQADLVLFVTDGVASTGIAPPKIACPWFFIHTGNTPATRQLGHLAATSGGDDITLSPATAVSGLAKLTQIPPRLISVDGNDVKESMTGERVLNGQRLRVFGTLAASRGGSLEIGYGYGEEVTVTRTVSYQPEENASEGIVRRLHAQRVLVEMENQFPPDREAIITHCKREGLVSDFTSLIVLERLEDYAEHGIRPPEKELWKDYDQLVGEFEARKADRWSSAKHSWSGKLSWYGRDFPGYAAVILPRLKQVGIWKAAVEYQFKPEQRDTAAFGVIAGWYGKGVALIEQIPKIRTAAEYEDWQKEIDALHKQGADLSATPLHAPAAGKDLAVSVRGLVSEPGMVTSGKPLTLRDAIARVGGVHSMGSLDNVALYRNAGKTVYNTLSEKFEDLPLFPMDMVVIGMKHEDYSGDGFFDPFSDGGGSPLRASPSQEEAIREQGDVWVRPGQSEGEIGTLGGDGGGDAKIKRIVLPDATSEKSPDAAEFEKQLNAGGKPEATYRKHRGEAARPQLFYIEAARMLFLRKEDTLAKRVLSNLAETRPGDVSALRTWAYWLAEFGKTEDAENILKSIPRDSGADALVNMDLASLRVSRGKPGEARADWSRSMGDIVDDGNFAAIALTTFNSLRKQGAEPFPGYDSQFSRPLPADIRIVITTADDTSSLRLSVTEPGGFQCQIYGGESPSGGRITASRGVLEYMIRRAVPGNYRAEFYTSAPTTIRVSIHTDWGRVNQTTRTVTMFADANEFHRIADLEFAFRPAE